MVGLATPLIRRGSYSFRLYVGMGNHCPNKNLKNSIFFLLSLAVNS